MFAEAPFRWTEPATWPWMIYLWLAFFLAGWLLSSWRWFRRRQAAGWPIADGKIETTNVSKPNFSLTKKRGYYYAELRYSYSISGNVYSGVYKHELPTQAAADDFVRDLNGKAIAVRYSLRRPSQSIVLESDIEVVLQNRPPSGDAESVARNPLPEWLTRFIWIFVWLSAIGLAASLWVHIAGLAGRTVPSAFWVLHVGIFVVWFPAVLVAGRIAGNTSRKDLWKVVLKGAPDWMRYMIYGFSAYGFISFIIFAPQAFSGSSHAAPKAPDWAFSDVWMVFYSTAFAILYSAAKIMESGPRCTNGHLALPNARYCVRCGQPVVR